jgi:protein NrfD
MSDTFFTAPPHWRWLIIGYFFIGGIAGGSYFIAALLDLFGAPRDRLVARLGYYVALVGIVASAALLTVDLARPERFWHMLIQSERGWPMFKWWSPMSIGSWGITLFGLFAFLSALGAIAEEGWVRWAPLRRLHGGILGAIIPILGGVLAFFVAGYTVVLLSVTNRSIWADTNLLGVLFLFSGASTAAATLILLGRWRAAGPGVVHFIAILLSLSCCIRIRLSPGTRHQDT